MRRNQAVDSFDCRQHYSPRDDLESSAPMPQVRISDRRVYIFNGPHRQELQSLLFDQRLKQGIRDDGHPMHAGAERKPECDKRMNVAGTAECGQEDVKAPAAGGRWRHHRSRVSAARLKK
jgi:hypothetical protein